MRNDEMRCDAGEFWRGRAHLGGGAKVGVLG